mgnify:CR=1 FL=1
MLERSKGGYDNRSWQCEERAKNMVDWMATMVRVEGNGRVQNGRTKLAWVRRTEEANQRLITFNPTTSLFFFLAHVGGCATCGGGSLMREKGKK